MPLTIPLAYYFLLPRPSEFTSVALPSEYEDEASSPSTSIPYTPIPTTEVEDEVGLVTRALPEKTAVSLSIRDKWRLVKPLLPKYMLPLCASFTVRCYTKLLTWSRAVCVYLVRHSRLSASHTMMKLIRSTP